MERVASVRFNHAITAGIVLLAHVLLIWLFILARSQQIENGPTLVELVIATLIDQPRNLTLGPVPMRNQPAAAAIARTVSIVSASPTGLSSR